MISFVYDIVCPYAYMAATQIEALADRHGATLAWEPVLLGGLFQHHDAPAHPAEAWPAAKAALGRKDLLRAADARDLPLRIPDAHPQRSVDAMRLCVAAPPHLRAAVSLALFRAYWVAGEDLTSPALLDGVAADHGLPRGCWREDAARSALRENTAAWAGRGAFGVPTVFVGEEHWWGVDRLHFVEQALTGAPEADPPPAGPSGQTVRFFHDFASPFSYLAATQIERVAHRHGATVEWRPILLGALFRTIGTPLVPLRTFSPSKQRYVLGDLHRWAAWWQVGFQFPSCFPVRTVLPLRVALQAPEATLPLYRALWQEDRDIGQPEVVAEVLTGLGLDAPALLAGAGGPAVKERLRENTEMAQRTGVVGVPTFALDDGMLIWGQDRLSQLDRALSGWRPRPEAR